MESKLSAKNKSTDKINKSSAPKNPFADVAVISLNDFQRIQQTTKAATNVQEEINKKKILKTQTEQKFSTQKNLKERMKEIDYEKHLKEKESHGELDEATTNKLLIKVILLICNIFLGEE